MASFSTLTGKKSIVQKSSIRNSFSPYVCSHIEDNDPLYPGTVPSWTESRHAALCSRGRLEWWSLGRSKDGCLLALDSLKNSSNQLGKDLLDSSRLLTTSPVCSFKHLDDSDNLKAHVQMEVAILSASTAKRVKRIVNLALRRKRGWSSNEWFERSSAAKSLENDSPSRGLHSVLLPTVGRGLQA